MAQYSRLGPYYDLLGWADFTHRLWPHINTFFKLIGNKPTEFLDIACGTGVLAGLLSDMDIKVTGIDICREMIMIARSRKYRIEPKFIVKDMRDFDLKSTFPVTGCFYDTINHILRKNDVRRAFRCAYEHTEPEGYFLFDVNTTIGLRNWKPFYSASKGRFYVTQRGRYNPKNETGAYRVQAFVKRADGEVEFLDQTIEERAYSKQFLSKALAEAGFRRVAFKPFEQGDSVDESERLLVICRK